MVNTYTIWLKKNNTRVSAGRLSGADTRLFHKELEELLKAFESYHCAILNDTSLLIVVDGHEYYRQRSNLERLKISTIEHMINHITEEDQLISHILVDGILTIDKTKPLSGIYVLELFTQEMYQSESLTKKTKR